MTTTLEELLEKTSRTFALSIPVLPEPTRRQVMLAYLLFRIADTFEDASHWPAPLRIDALNEFRDLLHDYSPEKAARLSSKWTAAGVSPHAGYRQLISETPFVLDAFFQLDPEAVASVRDHVSRSAEGMAKFVARTDGGVLILNDMIDLRAYCYSVAGIVGEMLSELFLLKRPALLAIAPYLRERASTFGEALQLVNILKDAADDETEGRSFLPKRVPRSEVFGLAREDLAIAAEYTVALQDAGAPRGLVEFCALPVELAWATLRKVEERGPGSKVSHLELFAIRKRLERALDRNEPAVVIRR
ncbi:MAG TPA: squalene/phytoene synthase family protein [Thermoanaerobaculia bacterium]|nr:squalene/phytoene synthase family protein [Thermoanaerobaculia bacterium]